MFKWRLRTIRVNYKDIFMYERLISLFGLGMCFVSMYLNNIYTMILGIAFILLGILYVLIVIKEKIK